jgi:MoaA/NifB/PqqE/SkfB family radical SAM enzyme
VPTVPKLAADAGELRNRHTGVRRWTSDAGGCAMSSTIGRESQGAAARPPAAPSVSEASEKLRRLAAEYRVLRSRHRRPDSFNILPSLTDFPESGWAYWAIKDINSTALAINRALGDTKMPAMPEVVVLSNTAWCNLRCPQCPTHGTDEAHREYQQRAWTMADATVRRIANESFAYARQISFSGSGEPLLARNVDVAADEANRYGAYLFINSNGTTLVGRRLKSLWGIANIRVSLDGATPPTFEGIRLGAKFGKVMRNVRIVTRAAELLPRSLAMPIDVNFGITFSNVRDLPVMVDLARALGVNKVFGFKIEDINGRVADDVIDRYPEVYAYWHDLAVERAKPYGRLMNLPKPKPGVTPAGWAKPWGDRLAVEPPPDSYYSLLPSVEEMLDLDGVEEEAEAVAMLALEGGIERLSIGASDAEMPRAEELRRELLAKSTEAFAKLTPAEHAKVRSYQHSEKRIPYCDYLFSFLYTAANGDARPCCYEKIHVVGNVLETSVSEVFNGDVLRSLSRRFGSGDMHPTCAGCNKWTWGPESAVFPYQVRPSEPNAGHPI